MDLLTLVKIEFIKQKRSFLWKIVLLIPVLSVCLFAAYVKIKYNSIISPDFLNSMKEMGVQSRLDALLYINHLGSIWFMLSSTVFALTSIRLSFTEHSENCWKYLLAMPVKRSGVYISKWIVILIFSIIPIVINAAGFSAILFIFKLGDCFRTAVIFKYVIFQILCSMGIISFQFIISCCFKNILVPLSIAFIGIINSFMFAQSKVLSYMIPYTQTLRAFPTGSGDDALAASIAGLVSGILWLLAGLFYFNRKDV